MPKVSVIVPVYNAEKTLHRCIDSILSQTFTDFELILINDGSTDNSGKICDDYAQKDSRIIVIHKDNGGVSATRNKGLDIAQGEWITFVDSDDYISETYLSDFPKNSENELEICGLISFSGQSFISSQSHIRYVEKDVVNFYEDLFKYRANTSVWAKIIKRSIIIENNIKFDVNMTLAEDTMFIINLLNHTNNIQIINNTNYYYNSPINIAKKYDITPEQIKYNLEHLTYSAKKLREKYNFNLCKITEPMKYFYYTHFFAQLRYLDVNTSCVMLRRYRKCNLYKYRPKMSFKESLYLLLKVWMPKFMHKI